MDVNEELFRVRVPGGRQGSQGQVDVLNSLKKVKYNSTLHSSYPHKQSEAGKLGYLYDAQVVCRSYLCLSYLFVVCVTCLKFMLPVPVLPICTLCYLSVLPVSSSCYLCLCYPFVVYVTCLCYLFVVHTSSACVTGL